MLISASFLGVYGFLNAQIKSDTLQVEEVVITGQFNAQSIKKSLYKVEVISSDDIKRMAVNNVAEVLNQTLNVLIIPEKNSGDSKANILGLGADYTKILIDNIPVIGDTGIGSNIDLTKLTLDSIERIEIVKGSMGVEFGNNAIAGVINIITKKNIDKKWSISGFIQEETVGDEYNWIDKGEGRHIQSLTISNKISDKFFISANINRNDFQGFWGNLQGKNYFEQDNKRGYLWQPKEILNPNILLRYSTPTTQIFYKFDFLNEEINYYNPIVETKLLGAGNRTFVAKDRDYFTQRMLHHLNIQTKLFKNSTLSTDFSYQKQTRENQDYVFDIPARSVLSKQEKQTYFESETLYSRGTLSNFLKTKNLNTQIGYEFDSTKGFAGWSTGSYNGANVNRDVTNVSLFAAAEINLSSQWFLRPGIRINYSSIFETKPNFSVVIKNKISDRSEFRAIVGSSNRNPSFEELFTYFVDSNHDIRGNENLKPESSYSGSLFYTVTNKAKSDLKWNIDISTLYLMMQNRIDVSIVNQSPVQYRYLNINSYESWQNTITAKLSKSNWGISLGGSILGRSMELADIIEDKLRFSAEINSSFYYTVPKTNTTFSLYYKGVGKSYSITEDESLGITQYLVGKRDAFSLMDFSIAQKFWNNHINFTLGVRNIFDVSQVDNLNVGGGTHGITNAGERLFYGRSYFGRLTFNF